jgi:hypothetical protein
MTKAKNAVDPSHYSEEERAIIAYVERSEGRPLTQDEINLSLAQAWPLAIWSQCPNACPRNPFA